MWVKNGGREERINGEREGRKERRKDSVIAENIFKGAIERRKESKHGREEVECVARRGAALVASESSVQLHDLHRALRRLRSEIEIVLLGAVVATRKQHLSDHGHAATPVRRTTA